MKKMLSLATAVVVAVVAVTTMASCVSDDVEQAYDLNGYWAGTIEGNYYYNRYHDAGSWDTEIWFVQDGDFSSGGYGREIDYSLSDDQSYTVDFTWEVKNGKIYIDYDDNYSMVIRDYELYSRSNSQRFKGVFADATTGEQIAWFDLVKTGNWSDNAKRCLKHRNTIDE